MKKEAKKQFAAKKYLVILAVFFLVGLIVTISVYFKDSGRYSANSSILFAFDGAANGVTPSGDEFDINGISTDDVLTAALTECNLQDKYTPDQIRGSLYVRGVYPADIADQILSFDSMFDYESSKTFTHDGFHATRYNIALYNDFDSHISKDQLSKILSAVMTAYQTSFKAEYSETWDAKVVDLNLENYDYIQQLSILNERMDQVGDYASQMYQKESNVITGGQTFNDISIRIRNLSDNEIPRLRALIILGGLSKDPERLLLQYQYEIENLSIRFRNQKVRLEEVEELLDAYEKNEVLYISSGDSFTKIDGNSSETYDQLVSERRSVANGITEIKTDISERLLRMSDILGEDAESSEYIVQVNEMLQEQMSEEEYRQILDELSGEGGENADITGEPEDTDNDENPENPDEEALPEENTTASIRKGRIELDIEEAQLEADIYTLFDKIVAIENDFNAMLQVYNDEQFNDMTVVLFPTDVSTKKLLSGAFIKAGIKNAGPFMAIGVMICLIMLLKENGKKTSLPKEKED